MSRVTAVATPATPEQMGRAFLTLVPDATRSVVRMFVAHWAFETGWGGSMINNNVANEKSSGKSGDWTFFKCGENVTRAEAKRAMAASQLVTLKNPDTDDGASSPVEVVVMPEHPWCRFTAYPSLAAGVSAYVTMMRRDFPRSWDALLSGDVDHFVEILKSESFFTAATSVYRERYDGVLRSVDKRAASFLATLPEGGETAPLAGAEEEPSSFSSSSSEEEPSSSSDPGKGASYLMKLRHKVVLIAMPVLAVLGFALARDTPAAKRLRLVALIRGEIESPDPSKYWDSVLADSDPAPAHWCGALILWALRALGLTDAHWVRGKGFIYPIGLPQITAAEVQIGDVAYYNANQHQAMVSVVHGDGRFMVLNGNSTGGAITETETTSAKVAAFYSIRKLVS